MKKIINFVRDLFEDFGNVIMEGILISVIIILTGLLIFYCIS